jgi:hypothetical protein
MKKKEIKKQIELSLEDLDQVTGGAGGYPVDFIGAGLGDQARLKSSGTTTDPNAGKTAKTITYNDPVTGQLCTYTVYC